MAAITIPGENLIARKQSDNEVLNIDRIVLAYIPGLDPNKEVDRNEQLPPQSQIVLDEPVSQQGYINPNLVVYSLMLDTGGDAFNFNWMGLYASSDDVVIAITYLPTQIKDPAVAMTRNFMIEFSGAQETTDIHVDAESWQVDFSARLNGIDERVRQLSVDTIGRQLFYGDACLVTHGNGGQYHVTSGDGHVGGIRFSYIGMSVLVTKFPSSIWMDVCQKTNSMSDIEPEAVAVVSQTDRTDYVDQDGVNHYLEKVAIIESGGRVIDYRRLHTVTSTPRPDFHMPLNRDIHIREGVGTISYDRAGSATYHDKSGFLCTAGIDEPRFEKYGVRLETEPATNYCLYIDPVTEAENNRMGFNYYYSTERVSIEAVTTDLPTGEEGRATKVNNIDGGYIRLRNNDRNMNGTSAASCYFKNFLHLEVVGIDSSGYTGNTALVDSNGNVTVLNGNPIVEAELVNGWVRISVTDTDATEAIAFEMKESTEMMMIYGQVEELYTSSYIYTSGTPVTRLSDSPIRIGTRGNLNNPVGDFTISVYCHLIGKKESGALDVWSLSDLKQLELRYHKTPQTLGNLAAFFNNDGVHRLYSFEEKNVFVYVKEGNEFKLYQNGVLLGRNAAEGVHFNDLLDFITLASGGASHISDFKIWDTALSVEQVLSLGVA